MKSLTDYLLEDCCAGCGAGTPASTMGMGDVSFPVGPDGEVGSGDVPVTKAGKKKKKKKSEEE